MRLSNRIHQIIKKNAINSFGHVNIYLFGSRTDDTKKGGMANNFFQEVWKQLQQSQSNKSQ